jgi:D-sedoheptulose 7-phosphate isomerase
MTGGDGFAAESLYPFLSGGSADPGPVLAEVRRSTEEKARETVELRRTMVQRYAEELTGCARALAGAFARGARLFAFGNGGSGTDASAIAALFLDPPDPSARRLPAVSLVNDTSVVTALSNDVGFEVVFARQVAAWGRAGDIAVGLSTSGGSANVLRAFDEAARRGMLTVGLAGDTGGRMAQSEAIEHLFVVPSASIHRIQEVQVTTFHVLWELTQLALADPPA